MSRWKKGMIAGAFAVAGLAAVLVGTSEAQSGRDNAACVHACNETRTACTDQCAVDCAGDLTCEQECHAGCVDDSKECKQLCSPKEPPTNVEP